MYKTNAFKYNTTEKFIILLKLNDGADLFENDEVDSFTNMELSSVIEDGLKDANIKIISSKGGGFLNVEHKPEGLELTLDVVCERNIVVTHYPSNNYYDQDDYDYEIDENINNHVDTDAQYTDKNVVECVLKALKQSKYKDDIQDVVSIRTDEDLLDKLLNDDNFNDLVDALL